MSAQGRLTWVKPDLRVRDVQTTAANFVAQTVLFIFLIVGASVTAYVVDFRGTKTTATVYDSDKVKQLDSGCSSNSGATARNTLTASLVFAGVLWSITTARLITNVTSVWIVGVLPSLLLFVALWMSILICWASQYMLMSDCNTKAGSYGNGDPYTTGESVGALITAWLLTGVPLWLGLSYQPRGGASKM